MWIKQFIHLYKHKTIKEAFALKALHIPERLFKYRAISEYSLLNLKENTVWMCNPNLMNDPYDSGLCFNSDSLSQKMIKSNPDTFIKETGIKEYLSNQQIEQIIQANDSQEIANIIKTAYPSDVDLIDQAYKILNEYFNDHHIKILKEFNVTVKNSLKICSFSERNDSILMWSHYTNQHTGFCIEYNFHQLIEDIRNRSIYPVYYSNELFDATDFLSETNNIYYPIIASLYKAEEWSYEKEWRLIIAGGIMEEDQNWQMPKAKAVYLGSRIKDEDKNKIIAIAKETKLEVFQMKLAASSFKLESTRINIE